MREAWFEIVKAAGDRKGVSEAYKRRAKKKLAERQALERELENVTGKRGAIFDIKGRATNQDIRDEIAEENRAFRQSQSRARRKGLSQGVKNILGRGKEAAKKIGSAFNPMTYLPDPKASGGGSLGDLRSGKFPNVERLANQPFGGRTRVLTPEEAKQREEDRQKFLAQRRKESARTNIMNEFGRQGEEFKENRAIEEQKRIEEAQKKRREELSRIADEQAKKEEQDKVNEMGRKLQARKDAARIAEEQAKKEARAAKIKQMGDTLRERKAKEEERRNFKMTTPAALTQFQQNQNKPLTFQQQLEQKFGSPTGITPKPTTNPPRITPEYLRQQESLKRINEKRNRMLQESAERLGIPKNQPQTQQTQQTQQPQQSNQLQQMSQQGQQQRKQTQQALQQQAGSQQKRANWQKVLQQQQKDKSGQVPI